MKLVELRRHQAKTSRRKLLAEAERKRREVSERRFAGQLIGLRHPDFDGLLVREGVALLAVFDCAKRFALREWLISQITGS